MASHEKTDPASTGLKISKKERRRARRESFQPTSLNLALSTSSSEVYPSDKPSPSHEILELDSSLAVPFLSASEIAQLQFLAPSSKLSRKGKKVFKTASNQAKPWTTPKANLKNRTESDENIDPEGLGTTPRPGEEEKEGTEDEEHHTELAPEKREEDTVAGGNLDPLEEPAAVETLQRIVLNAIIAASYIFYKFLPFPFLLENIWAIILDNVHDRNPLETCGDAAMNVVITEILIERFESVPNGNSLRKVITGLLLSNATFFHLLRNRSLFTEDTMPKYPGNALEVFAAALAMQESIPGLKRWVGPAFEPFIAAAIDACETYKKTQKKAQDKPPPPPVSKVGKARVAKEEPVVKRAKVDDSRFRPRRTQPVATTPASGEVQSPSTRQLMPSTPFTFAAPAAVASDPPPISEAAGEPFLFYPFLSFGASTIHS
ncbi:hypothetical protein DFH09DRAFT_1318869 [Mycena vulgaris]|nr:hypothetical protein DFH09DRAFT_1318869 [Mycena vulgaris]